MKKFKSGFVAVLGRPNAGKSTLINNLVGSKISIISPIPQTTRHQIKAILNLEEAQVVFVDTPGLHSFKDKLSSHLNTIAKKSLEGCDLIVYVVDTCRRPAKEEQALAELLSSQKINTIMVLNKIDKGRKYLNNYIDLWQRITAKNKKPESLLYYIPVSAKTGRNTDKLKTVLLDCIPEGEAFYDKDTSTDFPLKFRIADIIREKLFWRLGQELPHSIAVEVSEIKDKGKRVYLKINIYVKRNSQKKIVVGKSGAVLKEVGSLARKEIEVIYNKKAFLEIRVKVMADWQDNTRVLKELGYWWV